MKVKVSTVAESGMTRRVSEMELVGQIIRMTARAGEKGCPWSDDHKHYSCSLVLRNTGARMRVDFWIGAAWDHAPHVADVFDCLVSDASLVDEADNFEDFARNLGYDPDSRKAYAARHGAVVGFPGLTYYKDTQALYDHFQDEIWEMVNDMADQNGQTPLELIASFSGAQNVTDHGTFCNLLVWFAAEEYARQLTE